MVHNARFTVVCLLQETAAILQFLQSENKNAD